MKKTLSTLILSVAMGTASFGALALTAAPPAQACTGDPCDGFCATYPSLPQVVKDKVFHSQTCPLR